MTVASDLIEATRAIVLGDRREEMTTLAVAISSTSATSCTLTDSIGPVRRGAVLSVDLEDMYVTAFDTGTKVATVIRGYRGSTAATHLILAPVRVNAHYSAFTILGALNADLNDLSGQIPYYKATTITYDSAYGGYALPAGVLSVYDLRWEASGTRRDWPRITNYELAADMDAGEFAQGTAVLLYEGATHGQSMRLTYRANYTPISALSDNILTAVGLPLTAHDIPPLGAAVRLIRGSEVSRNLSDAQSETRRAEEVPPGARMQSANGLARQRVERIRTERIKIERSHPIVRRGRR